MQNKVLDLQSLEMDNDVEMLASTLSVAATCKNYSTISVLVC